MTVSILLGVLVAVGLAQSRPGFRFLESVGLAAPAEPHTELYFASPSAPGVAKTARGRGRQRVSFVIANREQAGVTYEWTIRSSMATGALHGKVRVPRGWSVGVARELSLVCGRGEKSAAAQQVQVQVSLADPSESIDYWTQCNA